MNENDMCEHGALARTCTLCIEQEVIDADADDWRDRQFDQLIDGDDDDYAPV